jgi:hypothetical protein
MLELMRAGDITESPDARDRGLVVGIGHDPALRIDRNASPGDVQAVSVRDAADGEQQDITRHLLELAVHTEVQCHGVGLLPHPLDLGVQEHGEAARIHVREALADLFVFAL